MCQTHQRASQKKLPALLQLKLYHERKAMRSNMKKQVVQDAACLLSRSVVSNSARPHGLQPTRLPCPWDFPSKNTGGGCHFLLQVVFSIQGSNLHFLRLPHCREILHPRTIREALIGRTHRRVKSRAGQPRLRTASYHAEIIQLYRLPSPLITW